MNISLVFFLLFRYYVFIALCLISFERSKKNNNNNNVEVNFFLSKSLSNDDKVIYTLIYLHSLFIILKII